MLTTNEKWTAGLIRSVKDGGIWHIPRSNTTVTLHHSKKLAVMSCGTDAERAVEEAFYGLGWAVERDEFVCADCGRVFEVARERDKHFLTTACTAYKQ